ncbi:hypothetical protein [Burkholderia territorii]|uniref:hypothetical protein n=1 Tax=Burkholderia territorii TaxID=1503055 RepID=UPI000A4CD05A|nr:hypothetical protein [Burkholderia territorii]
MAEIIQDEQITAEMAPGYKPTVVDAGFDPLPLSELGDREFELLAYSLVKSEILSGSHPKVSKIALMQGVGERGRDCVLYHEGVVVGLIQCKKYTSRISQPQVVKELVKFVLFSIIDDSILPNPEGFTYNFYASSDFTGVALDFLGNYKDKIKEEIGSGNIKKYIEAAIEEYESLSPLKEKPPIDEVSTRLQKLTVDWSTGVDLTRRLYARPEVLRSFFNVKMMVSIDDAEHMMRKLLAESGLKFLTDEDLKHLQARITSANSDHRVSFGFVEFYGFSVEFFKSLNRAEFKDLMDKVTSLRVFMDEKLLRFLQSEVMKRIFDEITVPLIYTQKVHQFSVGLAGPYLIKRLSPIIAAATVPNALRQKYSPDSLKSSSDIVNEVSEMLFAVSERIMNGDLSQLVGDDAVVAKKIVLYRHLHQGFSNIDDARNRLKADLPTLLPAIEKIEKDIADLMSQSRTIVISDSSFFDDEDKIKKMSKTLGEIGELES